VIRSSCFRVFLFAGWFMASQLDLAKGREIVARWCNLAERRLDHLTELFDSGRWRRFYDEQVFLENIREAKTAVETWRDLLSREASRDNRAVDLSWLGRGRTTLPQVEFRPDPLHPSRIAAIPIDQPHDVPALPEDGHVVNEIHSVSVEPAVAVASVQDLAAVAARYPLLRNTL
jgi:hypothetical protein